MPINSVNTNESALIALQSLDETNSMLRTVQKQVSTGFRVADADPIRVLNLHAPPGGFVDRLRAD